jgi:hypothetical protein
MEEGRSFRGCGTRKMEEETEGRQRKKREGTYRRKMEEGRWKREDGRGKMEDRRIKKHDGGNGK